MHLLFKKQGHLASYETLPIVMVAFLEDNSAFVSDLLLCFEEWRPTFIHREDFGTNSSTPHPLGHFYRTFSPHPAPQRRCLSHIGDFQSFFNFVVGDFATRR